MISVLQTMSELRETMIMPLICMSIKRGDMETLDKICEKYVSVYMKRHHSPSNLLHIWLKFKVMVIGAQVSFGIAILVTQQYSWRRHCEALRANVGCFAARLPNGTKAQQEDDNGVELSNSDPLQLQSSLIIYVRQTETQCSVILIIKF